MGAVTHPRTHISVPAQTTMATAGIPRKSLSPPACGIFHGTREAPMEMPGQVPRVPRKLRPMQVGGGTAGDEASEGREGRTWAKGCVDKQCLEGDLVAPGASPTSHSPSPNQAPEAAIVTLGQWRPVSCKPLWFKKEGQNYLDKLHSNRRLGEK